MSFDGSIKMAPFIRSADVASYACERAAIGAQSADCGHIDVMDGHFVASITFGPFGERARVPFRKAASNGHVPPQRATLLAEDIPVTDIRYDVGRSTPSGYSIEPVLAHRPVVFSVGADRGSGGP